MTKSLRKISGQTRGLNLRPPEYQGASDLVGPAFKFCNLEFAHDDYQEDLVEIMLYICIFPGKHAKHG